MKTNGMTKLKMLIVAVLATVTISSCSDGDDSYTWSGFVKVYGSYGSYSFTDFDGTTISPINQDDMPSDLKMLSYAYITAYYDAEYNEGTSSNRKYMEIYDITPIKTCSVSSEIEEMSTYSNVAIKSIPNNSTEGSLFFDFIYNMFVPVSYYCLDSDDADAHEFTIYYDLDEATETTLPFHLCRHVEDDSSNSSRLTYGTEYLYFKIDPPVYYYLVKFGSAPRYITIDFPYNSDNAVFDATNIVSMSGTIKYGEMYDSLTADYEEWE